MSILEYLPVGAAIAGLILRHRLSRPSANAVGAWERARARPEKPVHLRLVVNNPARGFAGG